MAMKKGYLCEDGKHLNITGENIDGLYDEQYLSSVEWIGVVEIADIGLDKIYNVCIIKYNEQHYLINYHNDISRNIFCFISAI